MKTPQTRLKGKVSRYFGGLQMILMYRTGVADIPLDNYAFLNSFFHVEFDIQSFQRVKLLLIHLAKA